MSKKMTSLEPSALATEAYVESSFRLQRDDDERTETVMHPLTKEESASYRQK